MPYNNTPIMPSKDPTGTASLPLARVKRIINADPDIAQCSNNAAFIITVATDLFLRHLVDQAYNQVKSEHASKPRRNVQYRDVANAVSRVENLEFLTDVVPKTMSFKQAKQKQNQALRDANIALGAAPGQRTLDGHMGAGAGAHVVVPVVPAHLDIMDVVEGNGGEGSSNGRESEDGDEDEEMK